MEPSPIVVVQSHPIEPIKDRFDLTLAAFDYDGISAATKRHHETARLMIFPPTIQLVSNEFYTAFSPMSEFGTRQRRPSFASVRFHALRDTYEAFERGLDRITPVRVKFPGFGQLRRHLVQVIRLASHLARPESSR